MLTFALDAFAKVDADGVVRQIDAVQTDKILQHAAPAAPAARTVTAAEAQVRARDGEQLAALRRAGARRDRRHGRHDRHGARGLHSLSVHRVAVVVNAHLSTCHHTVRTCQHVITPCVPVIICHTMVCMYSRAVTAP